MGVSKNNGTPKSSILIGFSIINHPFWGTPIFGNTHLFLYYDVEGFPCSSMIGKTHPQNSLIRLSTSILGTWNVWWKYSSNIFRVSNGVAFLYYLGQGKRCQDFSTTHLDAQDPGMVYPMHPNTFWGSLGGETSKIFGIFIPKVGEDEPNLTSIFFKWVGKNHQLGRYLNPTRHLLSLGFQGSKLTPNLTW